MTKTWYMVPVRGGSRGLPRKNMRILGDKPLVSHALQSIKQVDAPEQIIVVTDDPELKAIAQNEGCRVIMEPQKTDGKATLDDVCLQSLPEIQDFGAKDEDILLTIQATCPFVKPETIAAAKEKLQKNGGSVITVMDDRHLTWKLDDEGNPTPGYEARVNRQMLPANFRESGAVIGSVIKTIKETKTRINQPIQLVEISNKEGLDIDDFKDWAMAEAFLLSRKILFRADGGKKMGMGHLYRTMTIAHELAKYSPVIATLTNDESALGYDFLSQFPYRIEKISSDKDFIALAEKEKPEIIFLDHLATEKSYVEALKATGAKVVTFEDTGEGAKVADLVMSDLYQIIGVDDDKQLYGVKNAFLPSGFHTTKPVTDVSNTVDNILVLFGGSDPLKLTNRTLLGLQNIGYKGKVTVIQGMGQKDNPVRLKDYGLSGEVLFNVSYMAGEMAKADLAFSSAGRTITELMYLGIPTLCICQNERELTHTHASQQYGVHNIGLGSLVDNKTIENNIRFLIESPQFRKNMKARALHAMEGHSNAAVLKRMINHLGIEL